MGECCERTFRRIRLPQFFIKKKRRGGRRFYGEGNSRSIGCGVKKLCNYIPLQLLSDFCFLF
jgi:hypothetical protein